MPRDHLEQALLNRGLAGSLSSRRVEGRQWAVIAAFYSAVHAVRHAAIDSGLQPSAILRQDSHAWNEAWMRQHARDLYHAYRPLRRASELARYNLHDTSGSHRRLALQRADAILGPAQRGLLPLTLRDRP